MQVNVQDDSTTTERRTVRRRDRDGLHKRGQIWHTRVKIDGKWREVSLKTTSHTEAKRIRSERTAEVEARLRLPNLAKLTLTYAAEHWLAERGKVGGLAPATLRIDRERLKAVKARLGAKRLCELTPADLRAYQVVRIKEVSSRTCNLELKVIRQMLKAAKLWSKFGDDYKPLRENRKGPGPGSIR